MCSSHWRKRTTTTLLRLPNARLPLILPCYARVVVASQDDKERYLADVNLRPDEADFEAYESVPVDAFGAAALRGMGWKEGEAIGATNKGLAAPIVGIPRLPRLGLGARRDTELQPDKRKPKKYERCDSCSFILSTKHMLRVHTTCAAVHKGLLCARERVIHSLLPCCSLLPRCSLSLALSLSLLTHSTSSPTVRSSVPGM